MNRLEELKKERELHRERVKEIWKSGRAWTPEDNAGLKELNKIHPEILELELKDPATIIERIGYSVCGWSEKHAYFRNKYFTSEDLEEAKAEFEKLKKDPSWGIPTIIVKETKLRNRAGSVTDFDNVDFEHLGFAEHQDLISKHMCGNRQYRWNDLLHFGDNYTY